MAEDVECQTFITEQQGREGTLIKNLCLLQKTYSKPASTNLVAEDGTTLQNDKEKLNR